MNKLFTFRNSEKSRKSKRSHRHSKIERKNHRRSSSHSKRRRHRKKHSSGSDKKEEIMTTKASEQVEEIELAEEDKSKESIEDEAYEHRFSDSSSKPSTPREEVHLPMADESPPDMNAAVTEVDSDEKIANLEKAVVEHAKYLGLDPVLDQGLLWIAKEALMAPIPEGWNQGLTDDGVPYYYNEEIQESKWEHPLDEKYKERVRQEKAKVLKEQVGSNKSSMEESLNAEIKMLKENNNEIKMALEKLKAKEKESENKYKSLKKELMEECKKNYDLEKRSLKLKKEAEESAKLEVESLKKQIASQEQSLDDKQIVKELDSKKKETLRLQESLDGKEIEIEELREEINALLKKQPDTIECNACPKLRSEMNILKEKELKLDETLIELSSVVESRDKQKQKHSALKIEKERLMIDLVVRDKKIDDMENEKLRLHEELENRTKSLKKTERICEAKEKNLENLEEENAKLSQKVLQGERKVVEEKNIRLALEAKIRSLEKQNENLNHEIQAYKKELELNSSKEQKVFSEDRIKLEVLKKDVHVLEKSVEKKSITIKDQKNETISLSKRLKTTQDELCQKQKLVEDLRKKLERLQEQNAGECKEKGVLKEKLECVRVELSFLKAIKDEFESCKDKFRESEAYCLKLDKLNLKLSTEIEVLRKQAKVKNVHEEDLMKLFRKIQRRSTPMKRLETKQEPLYTFNLSSSLSRSVSWTSSSSLGDTSKLSKKRIRSQKIKRELKWQREKTNKLKRQRASSQSLKSNVSKILQDSLDLSKLCTFYKEKCKQLSSVGGTSPSKPNAPQTPRSESSTRTLIGKLKAQLDYIQASRTMSIEKTETLKFGDKYRAIFPRNYEPVFDTRKASEGTTVELDSVEKRCELLQQSLERSQIQLINSLH
eukprot:snap_masked-scaffold_1-processed-gene-1.16-mRNA-1 protein AED:0.85 eAED:0.85 QI:0/-1/0/1/-1/1/1/0/888